MKTQPAPLLVGYNVIARRFTRRGGKKLWRALGSCIVATKSEAMQRRDAYILEFTNCMVDIIPLYNAQN